MIKVDTFTNAGIVENYDTLAVRTLTNDATFRNEGSIGSWDDNVTVNNNGSKYKEKRNVVGYNVKSDYTSDVAFARIMNGFHIPVKYFVFTPEAGLRYLWMKVNGYTDNIGQTAGDRSTYSLTGVIGMKFGAKTKLIGFDKIMFWPEVAVRGTYDFIKADNDVFVNLPNNSAYKIKGETLDRLGFETAAKLGILSGNIDVSLEYLGRYRKNYNDHTGLISFKYHF